MNLQIGITGTAGIVPYHIKKLRKIDGVTCKWIHSRNLERARQFADTNAIPNATDRLQDILDDESVDILMIFTEPTRHVDIALQGLAAGKHMLIEKPLDVDPVQGERLLLASKGSDRIIGVFSQYRFDPTLQKMKKILRRDARDLAKTATLTFMHGRDESYYRGGTGWRLSHSPAFMNQGIHWLDVLNWFFGEPIRISATSKITRPFLHCSDMSAALIDYPGDVSVVVHGGTFGSGNMSDQFTILHPKGFLDYQTLKGPLPPKGLRERLGRKLLGQPVWGEPDCDRQFLALADFIAAVRNNSLPASTLADGLAALKLAHSISGVG
jgi:UDP-N-acetyl-2-amino-2-deoxyglucuronate dehydrogenase